MTRRVDIAILLAGWVAFLVYAYPGYMSFDSAWQLSQARGLEPINDWNPPVMAVMWRLTDAIVAGPFPMLAIQSIAFLVGTYALLLRVTRAAAIVAVVFLLLPHNIIVMAGVWKDSQMAGFLLAAIALLLSSRPRVRAFGFFFVFLATAVRYNAAAPTFPIVLGLWTTRGTKWPKQIGIGFAIWFGITAAALLANRLVTEERRDVFATGAAPVDIYGVIRFSDIDKTKLVAEHPRVPWQCSEDIKHHVDKWYRPTNYFTAVFEGDSAIMRYPVNDEERAAIKALWRELLASRPGALIRHRYEVGKIQLHVRVPVWFRFAPDDATAQRLHLDTEYWSAQLAWAHAMQRLVRSKYFRPALYFVLAFVLLAFARRQRLASVLLASGIAHEIGLFFVAPAVDYRYSHWMVCATILGAIVLFEIRRRPNCDVKVRAGEQQHVA